MKNCHGTKVLQLAVLGAIALGLTTPSVFGAQIQNKLTRYGVPWANPTSWTGGVVPGASDDVKFSEVCDFLYDVGAPGTVGSMSGKALKLTLARNLEVRDLFLLEGHIADGGKNLKVTGTLSNGALGYPQPGGGRRTAQGGNLELANLSLARVSFYTFVPGDTISGTYTASNYQGFADITVSQDVAGYADRLDKGLSFDNEAAGAIALGGVSAANQADITLNWDAGMTGAIDWTLRWKGDHVSALRTLHANRQIIVNKVPTGMNFDPAENIFFDAPTGYTYVGFKAPTAASFTTLQNASGVWSTNSIWQGGRSPDANSDIVLWTIYGINYDTAANGPMKSISGENVTLTLQRDLVAETVNLRQGTIADGGKNLTAGTLTNNSGFWFDGNGGMRQGQGGNFFLGNLALARTGLYTFYPGDTISGSYTTAMINNTWPDISVTQEAAGGYYGNRLDKGLSFENPAAGAISLGRTSSDNQSKIMLNWNPDSLNGPVDWTLRWKGNHVLELQTYYTNGQIVPGSLPQGFSEFRSAENIFFDGTYTYVGFRS